MNIGLEPLGFRSAGFSPALSLLMPAYALPCAPPLVSERLPRTGNALLPPMRYRIDPALRWTAYTRLLSAHPRSTSELLRTL